MRARINMVTLGVSNIASSVTFYAALGWNKAPGEGDDVAFFQGNGTVLGLYGRGPLAEDANVPDTQTGFPAIALAVNLESPEAVDVFFATALTAGASQLKAPQDVFWGGYSGYFADPDGHIWEVAHNPFFPLDERGNIVLPRLAGGETK